MLAQWPREESRSGAFGFRQVLPRSINQYAKVARISAEFFLSHRNIKAEPSVRLYLATDSIIGQFTDHVAFGRSVTVEHFGARLDAGQ